jgi:hypothetical protein
MVWWVLACAKVDPYQLGLTIHGPPGTEDLVSSSNVALLAIDANGVQTLVPVGEGGAERAGVPTIPDTAVELGLLAGGSDWDGTAADYTGLAAWGRAPIDAVPQPGERVDLELFVSPFGDVAQLGPVPPNRRVLAGALALDPQGTVWIAGGQLPGSADTDASDALFRLDLDGGDDAPEPLQVKLPKTTGLVPNDIGGQPDEEREYTGRVNLTATAVQVDGVDKILFAGGHPAIGFQFGPTSQALLLDTATETLEKLEMQGGRSSHLAARFSNGAVLLYGGFVDNAFPRPSYTIWTADKGFKDVWSSSETGAVHAAAAPFGEDVVVCGGDLGTSDGATEQRWTPQAGCVRIRPNGELRDFDPLPEPLSALAMAPTPDGGLLAVGGFSEPAIDVLSGGFVDSFGSSPAVASAYRWTAARGWESVGRLKQARAHHAAVALADGSVLVVGGDSFGTAYQGPLVDPLRCPERYDPALDQFTLLEGCSDATSGAYTMVAASPDEVVVMAGYTFDEATLQVDGGAAVGASSVGPPPE